MPREQTMASNSESPPEDWRRRMALIVETMQDISRQTDAQEMVRVYGERMAQLVSIDRRVSLSRRGLSYPKYRITRSTTWAEEINPWKEKERLPLFEGGLLAKLIYGDMPEVIDELEVAADDPAADYLSGCRSLVAIPMYDQGEALNMVVVMRYGPAAFPKEELPELVWRSNLFGRATSNLVLKEELRQAYEALDRELKIVSDIQRSLLPTELPKIPSLDLATYYQPSQRAGGDYYDFFPLPENKWGIIIADVSGHGTPAAVLMAVTHCIAHTHPGPPMPPGKVFSYLNHHLSTLYTSDNGHFVTAFYGVFDPSTRQLTYAIAGHPPPRLIRCQDGTPLLLDGVNGLPLGVWQEVAYDECVLWLQVGDQIIFYTDGITEAHGPGDELFGTKRLDQVLEQCGFKASAILDSVLHAVDEFVDGRPIEDDQTLIVARLL